MKKRTALLVIPVMVSLISCGPTAEQREAAERQRQDSITAAQAQLEAAKEAARQQAIDDSIAQQMVADSSGMKQ